MLVLVGGTQTITFDDAGRVTAVAQPGGKTVTYTYDNASRREAVVDPDGGRTTYSYDNASRLTSLLNPFTERTTWAYDAAGRATTITLANGTRTTMGYDDASQVTLIRHSKSDDTQVAKYEYVYNDAGVRTSVLEGNSDRVTWSYDNAWRLTREQRSGDNAYDITYSYDPVGSRATKLTGGVTTTYSYNAGDAVTGADAGGTLTTYAWDDAGNNTVVNANGTLTTYTWDGESRLATIQTASGTITLAYDAGGLRRTRQDASTTRKYVWDAANLLIETDGDGTTVAQYTGALHSYGPIVSQRRSSTSRFYHPSVLGTIETLTGADAGVTDTYILDAWGVQRASTGSTTNPFRYIGALGYYTEPDLGLAYVRARWLRPATGSWLSVDPVEEELRYAYVAGYPTIVSDETGEQWWRPIGAAARWVWRLVFRGGRWVWIRVRRLPWWAYLGPGGVVVYVGIQAARMLFATHAEQEAQWDIRGLCNVCLQAASQADPPWIDDVIYVVPLPGGGSVRCRKNSVTGRLNAEDPQRGWQRCIGEQIQ